MKKFKNSKEYLSQVTLVDIKIGDKLEDITKLRCRAESATFKFSDTKVQTSENKNFTDIVDKIVDLQKETNILVDNLIDLKRQISTEINSLDNNIYVCLLFKRYMLGKSLFEISKDLQYSYDHIRHLHKEALDAFRKKYPSKFR